MIPGAFSAAMELPLTKFLKDRRRQKGLTQAEAAAILGISRSAYIDLEAGARRVTTAQQYGIRPLMEQAKAK